MSVEVVQWVVGQGVAVGVLMWFMLRMEKRIEALTDSVKELCVGVTENVKRETSSY